MEIRYLKTFKTIVDLGGFTKAADYLGYAQSTVTFHIKSIEEEVGSPVFDRIGKKVFLTETGRLLLPHVQKMLAVYKDIREVASCGEEARGELVISAPEALLIYRLPPVIKKFKDHYPLVDLKLKHLNPPALKSELTQGAVDLAFIIDEEREEEGIYFEKLVKEPMVLISHDPISLHEKGSLENQVFLFTEKGCSYRALFEKVISHNLSCEKPEDCKGMEFWSIDALKECVLYGLGIGVLPYITVKREVDQSNLLAHPIKGSALFTQLAYHEDKWISPALRGFLDVIGTCKEGWEREAERLS